MADKLIKRGFPVVELKPSNKVRGKAAVLFDATPEFIETLSELSEESRKYHQNK